MALAVWCMVLRLGLGLTLALSPDATLLRAEPPAHHPILPQHRLPGKNLYAVSANTAQPAKNRAVPELLREVLKG